MFCGMQPSGLLCAAPGARGRGDLRRVLFRMLAYPSGEELDRHDTEGRMTTLARPVGIGQRAKQARELLVLGDDCCQEIYGLLSAGEAGAPISLLVEVGENGCELVQEPPAPQPTILD